MIPLPYQHDMHEVNIEIKNVAAREDIQRWEDHMLVKAKCWNQFCDGLYSENEIRAVHVVKEGNADVTYLTTLCEDYKKLWYSSKRKVFDDRTA